MEWILCTHCMPLIGKRVLVFDGSSIAIAEYYDDSGWEDSHPSFMKEITHWQFLPTTPN